ncbi:MAG TPA: CaiB/BaiF CoA-transferase family protein [Micavibrio sp.]|jgi:crotonobetainyl-CoA:carnitine CoA-transferase CaiB-like acyl-CoA transferase
MAGPLNGIRVLDLSRVLAGPACTQILGDLGADIIKVERPGAGDDTRKWGPPFLQDDDGRDTAESAYYLSANRNKRSIAIDIATPEGQDIIHRLLQKSDVMVENFKTGALEKFGLDYESIRKRHPHIVYASITGFGQTGPLAREPGYDFLAQAMGGLMASTGNPGEAPMKTGVALSDILTGLYTGIGILSALHERKSSGQGQRVDCALLDCTVASMVNLAQYYLTSGRTAPRFGNAHSTIVPYQAFRASDGYVIVAIGNDTQFRRLSEYLKQDWADDVRFVANRDRVVNRDILVPMIEPIMGQKTVAEWTDIFRTIDIPGGPVSTMDQVFEHEQIVVRDMEIKMHHPASLEPVHLVGSPLKLSRTAVDYRLPPPMEGQHTDSILRDILNLEETDIEKLEKAKVISVAGH